MLMKEVKSVRIADRFEIGGNKGKFTLLAGPCAIESEEMSIRVAGKRPTDHRSTGLEEWG